MIAVFAALIVVALAVSVVTAVLSAERNGRRSLESLQLAQLQQFARVFDNAFGPALVSPAGLTNPATGAAWTLAVGDPTDASGLGQMQAAQPKQHCQDDEDRGVEISVDVRPHPGGITQIGRIWWWET